MSSKFYRQLKTTTISLLLFFAFFALGNYAHAAVLTTSPNNLGFAPLESWRSEAPADTRRVGLLTGLVGYLPR